MRNELSTGAWPVRSGKLTACRQRADRDRPDVPELWTPTRSRCHHRDRQVRHVGSVTSGRAGHRRQRLRPAARLVGLGPDGFWSAVAEYCGVIFHDQAHRDARLAGDAGHAEWFPARR
ncbi:acetoacetate--CoA ligase family protein [Pseudonocardia sp. MCCB 268]|nr:acetoacetate--CoA ligase family protein [Pseudonocardia cytotoxica]